MGHPYAPMAAGSSARAARERDAGFRGLSFLLCSMRAFRAITEWVSNSPPFCSMQEPASTSATTFSKVRCWNGRAGGGASRWSSCFSRAGPIPSRQTQSRGRHPAPGLKRGADPKLQSCFVPPDQTVQRRETNDKWRRGTAATQTHKLISRGLSNRIPWSGHSRRRGDAARSGPESA